MGIARCPVCQLLQGCSEEEIGTEVRCEDEFCNASFTAWDVEVTNPPPDIAVGLGPFLEDDNGGPPPISHQPSSEWLIVRKEPWLTPSHTALLLLLGAIVAMMIATTGF